MSESVEVRVARMEEQLKFLADDAKEAKASRKSQYESIEALTKAVAVMTGKVGDVEIRLAGQAPTIEEFITIKHKVVGAGKLGMWLWTVLAFVIGAVFASREAIISWLTK